MLVRLLYHKKMFSARRFWIAPHAIAVIHSNEPNHMPSLAVNKRAFHDYQILEKFEAGLVLTGQETKSARQGHISLKGSFVTVTVGGEKARPEAWLLNAHISPYKPAGDLKGYEPTRSRKLLMHRREIDYLIGKKQQGGLTLIPLSLYTAKSKIKVEVALCKGKKQYDKREDMRKRESDRAIRRALRNKP